MTKITLKNKKTGKKVTLKRKNPANKGLKRINKPKKQIHPKKRGTSFV